MIPVNTEVTDLKGEFEGGKSYSIDWYAKLRLGASSMLDNINPDTLKRQVPIYGGLTKHLKVYYCPADVEVPSRIFDPVNAHVQFNYVPPRFFYANPQQRDVFTIEYVNGVRFIVARYPLSALTQTLAAMDGTDSLSGNVGTTLAKNTFNILPGSTSSQQGTFTDTLTEVDITLEQALDISSFLRGVAIVPAYFDSAIEVASVTLKLLDGDGNSFDMASTQDSVGDYLRDGQNMVRFWLNNAVLTNNPDPTNIVSARLNITMKSGKSQVVILGKISLQTSSRFIFEYQSNLVFVDKLTGAWKDTPVSGDYVNLNRDALGVLHYETCRKVIQSAKTERVNAAESQRIDTELARKYTAYYSRFPSSEQPLSYDISPDIAHSPDILDYAFDGMPETFGQSENAIQPEFNVNFSDGEVPTGAKDGVNGTFTLGHVPNPTASLEVVVNGQVLMLGQDYTLAGNTLTLIGVNIAIVGTGVPFIVNYRYSV